MRGRHLLRVGLRAGIPCSRASGDHLSPEPVWSSAVRYRRPGTRLPQRNGATGVGGVEKARAVAAGWEAPGVRPLPGGAAGRAAEVKLEKIGGRPEGDSYATFYVQVST